MMRTELHTDDLPDFLLEGFGDVKTATGRYPGVLVVSWLLAEMMHARPGLWTRSGAGGWRWRKFLSDEDTDGIDEFGMPD